jgi:membrane dipeptidase
VSQEGAVILAPSDEERAQRLHDQATVFITHDHNLAAAHIADMTKGGVTAKQLQISTDGQVWADLDVYLSSAPRISVQREYQRKVDEGSEASWYGALVDRAPIDAGSGGFTRRALVAMDYVMWQVERSQGQVRLAFEPADIVAAKKAGGVALLLGSEGSRLIEERFEVLRMLVRQGLRHIALSWAWDTPVGAPQGDRSGRGLTDYGRDLVRELNRLGVMVDVSHLARQSIRDAVIASSAPILMSHAGADALNPEQGRTVLLPDDMLQEIARRGGNVGVHFMSHFVKPGRNKAVVGDLVRMLAYLTELIGSEHVSCSPDYAELDPRMWENQGLGGPAPFSFPHGLEDISMFRNVTRGMVAGGFSDEDILNILGGSLLDFFGRVRAGASPLPAEYSPLPKRIGDATEGTTPW